MNREFAVNVLFSKSKILAHHQLQQSKRYLVADQYRDVKAAVKQIICEFAVNFFEAYPG